MNPIIWFCVIGAAFAAPKEIGVGMDVGTIGVVDGVQQPVEVGKLKTSMDMKFFNPYIPYRAKLPFDDKYKPHPYSYPEIVKRYYGEKPEEYKPFPYPYPDFGKLYDKTYYPEKQDIYRPYRYPYPSYEHFDREYYRPTYPEYEKPYPSYFGQYGLNAFFGKQFGSFYPSSYPYYNKHHGFSQYSPYDYTPGSPFGIPGYFFPYVPYDHHINHTVSAVQGEKPVEHVHEEPKLHKLDV